MVRLIQCTKTLSQLYEVQKAGTENRGPTIERGRSQVYIKIPDVSVCEILRRNPHPNIAAYYGCQETNGRLGLVHNDINPLNIMFDEDDNTSLRETRAARSPSWYDPAVETAEKKNDLDAFEDLKMWLIGDLEDKFLFSY
ncbi:uncharacterized protein BDV17DRAFT_279401 [Aspergillus undulatus]|uniref:uncharacterized protein n=1 Tax=Aspergillus undulatus TaxID=1810928 RepID=UPI003CCD4038